MARAKKSVWEFVYVVVAAMAMISAGAYASISCMTVSGAAAQPAKACCDGISSLNAAAKTKADRQAACKSPEQDQDQLSCLNSGNEVATMSVTLGAG
ncbi:hypothetical protein SUGI_0999430 [Cryptomeria japonica]|uniref:non-specific lipid-transfer protein 2-like n=1 Tax=Cryptomeria japonica TaxID=3369 RepID=UPI0024148BE1|nr:non-specific lipid-transfer protein 2-like [Cryptomeria japonica]GLJ47345.1 hypothetical protein SUGI_0999430 [Cryptomeria japonica]